MLIFQGLEPPGRGFFFFRIYTALPPALSAPLYPPPPGDHSRKPGRTSTPRPGEISPQMQPGESEQPSPPRIEKPSALALEEEQFKILLTITPCVTTQKT